MDEKLFEILTIVSGGHRIVMLRKGHMTPVYVTGTSGDGGAAVVVGRCAKLLTKSSFAALARSYRGGKALILNNVTPFVLRSRPEILWYEARLP